MNRNGYMQYREQSIMTMTQSELVIVLYDELIKRLKRAGFALDKEDYTDFEAAVSRSRDIIIYFKDSLNFNYEISYELARMYDFFLFELSRLLSARKKGIIEDLLPLIEDLREAFEIAGKTA
ncbi:flagellar protein FliS [Aequitasia blattaphilus]|uniref:Flagellar protein FliS n=1 Tax=Aequitasia blattaphilus TaxID=2949332 RepID=A0ABT1EA92_9FIRM|nr:flagellar export chaperone FliS [Aequitasia blattaphilus]MCP1102534.1 flagellar protein FliS [Aequitasia blattaphilus]MCR8615174.1 flagellar protein FliS [Aequitasia blattaphilus]